MLLLIVAWSVQAMRRRQYPEAPSCIRGVFVPGVRSKPYLNRRIEVQPRCLVTPARHGEGGNCARMEPLFAGTSQWFKTGVRFRSSHHYAARSLANFGIE